MFISVSLIYVLICKDVSLYSISSSGLVNLQGLGFMVWIEGLT